MIAQVMRRYFLMLAAGMFMAAAAGAQPLLPDMLGATQNGMNILTWSCQYDGIKSIAVQRSQDSVYNFATIGYVKGLAKGPQAFIDGHPLPGNNWYRLYIVFNSNLTWYGNYLKLVVDSAQLLQQRVLPPNDSLQAFAAKVKLLEAAPGSAAGKTVVATTSEKSGSVSVVLDTAATRRPAAGTKVPVIKVPDIASEPDAISYIKSQYVFTNPFTGHVNVEIPDASKHQYSIIFYNRENKQVLEVPRISEASVVIDKRNFQRKGLYKFDLSKDKVKLETGHVTIY